MLSEIESQKNYAVVLDQMATYHAVSDTFQPPSEQLHTGVEERGINCTKEYRPFLFHIGKELE